MHPVIVGRWVGAGFSQVFVIAECIPGFFQQFTRNGFLIIFIGIINTAAGDLVVPFLLFRDGIVFLVSLSRLLLKPQL